jgi:predicted metalloprotease
MDAQIGRTNARNLSSTLCAQDGMIGPGFVGEYVMRLDDEEESVNFEDRTGNRGGGDFGFPMGGGGLPLGRSMGCGTLAIVIIVALVFGVNPMQILGGDMTGTAPHQQQAPATVGQSTLDPQVKSVVLKVLGSTERRWADIFAKDGQRYRPTRLVLYSGSGQSGCGSAQSAMGPFYCPADESIYLDTDFFGELANRFGAGGDFVAAYVIAHEVGHHVQKLTGVADQMQAAQQRANTAQGNKLQVAMELQADCYAGVWANNDTNLMEPGDAEEGLRAAHQIGDDVLQRAAQGVVVEASFTHGSAEQRMTWLKKGLETGDPQQCETFGR